jgi:hypothetical protein
MGMWIGMSDELAALYRSGGVNRRIVMDRVNDVYARYKQFDWASVQEADDAEASFPKQLDQLFTAWDQLIPVISEYAHGRGLPHKLSPSGTAERMLYELWDPVDQLAFRVRFNNMLGTFINEWKDPSKEYKAVQIAAIEFYDIIGRELGVIKETPVLTPETTTQAADAIYC